MTPTATVLAAANERVSISDRNGRSIVARKLNALDKLRLLKAAGPQLSENQTWLGVAMLAASVVEIDGIPVPTPVTEQQIEALVGHLDDPGLDAIADALNSVAELPGTMAGNSPGTPT